MKSSVGEARTRNTYINALVPSPISIGVLSLSLLSRSLPPPSLSLTHSLTHTLERTFSVSPQSCHPTLLSISVSFAGISISTKDRWKNYFTSNSSKEILRHFGFVSVAVKVTDRGFDSGAGCHRKVSSDIFCKFIFIFLTVCM